MIIGRPNASPLQKNSLFIKLIIGRLQASPLRLLTPGIYRSIQNIPSVLS
ncbi:hypothetical protein H5968_24205 [Sphaerospermopsis sp. LEGE 00249]|nr:hypothetical protein [Sphaerospermopsis sp. LEGE 00249]